VQCRAHTNKMSVNTAIDPTPLPHTISTLQPDPPSASSPLATLHYTSKQTYIASFACHYDRLTALLPAEKVLNPVNNSLASGRSKTRKGKVQKTLLRMDSNKDERHFFYCTHRFDRPAQVEPVRGAENLARTGFMLHDRVVRVHRVTDILQVAGQPCEGQDESLHAWTHESGPPRAATVLGDEDLLFSRKGQRFTNKRSRGSNFNHDSNGRPAKIRRTNCPLHENIGPHPLGQVHTVEQLCWDHCR
jgi:hypothetical protein